MEANRLQVGTASSQTLRFPSQAGELKARETGDEHARDHGKEKEERRFLGHFVFFSQRERERERERRLGTRQRLGAIQLGANRLAKQPN